MDLQDLKTLVDYHYWARDRVLDAADRLTPEQYTKDLGSSFRSVRDTLAHTYYAEWAWHSRWLGTSPKTWPPSERFADVATLRRDWTATETKVRVFVDNLSEDEVERVFHYTLFSGQSGASPFRHMLQHMVNHASYHRGQVTTMLRQLGVDPPKSMDMITFYRERASGQ
jgi:uncharacterized damage-inducible protein DinB